MLMTVVNFLQPEHVKQDSWDTCWENNKKHVIPLKMKCPQIRKVWASLGSSKLPERIEIIGQLVNWLEEVAK